MTLEMGFLDGKANVPSSRVANKSAVVRPELAPVWWTPRGKLSAGKSENLSLEMRWLPRREWRRAAGSGGRWRDYF